MTKELKERIFTSILLISLLVIMFINKLVLLFFLILIYVLSFLEFANITKKIFTKKKQLQFIFNLIFLTYFFIYLTIFFFLNDVFSLKIFLYLCVLICIFSDVGGLIFGRLFKGPKLTKISPNKTISGSLGSFIFSFLPVIFFSLIFHNIIPLFILIILAAFISLGCQVGDILFSFLKRKANIKDTGNILPGHGGILDRIDGMMIGIPFGLLFLLILS